MTTAHTDAADKFRFGVRVACRDIDAFAANAIHHDLNASPVTALYVTCRYVT